MGLDSVEMVIAIEDRFGVVIDDADAQNTLTIGDLTNLVSKLLGAQRSDRCRTQHVFYRLRKSLPLYLRDGLHPSTEMSEVLPKKEIRRHYFELEKDLGLKLPGLKTPNWYKWLYLLLVLGSAVLIVLSLEHSFLAFFESIMGIVLACRAMNALREPLSTKLSAKSLRSFVELITSLNYHQIYPGAQNEIETLLLVRTVVSETMGIPMDEILPESHFVNDLGIQ